MATIISHTVVALTAGKVIPSKIINTRVLIAGMILSMLPDADVITFGLGIPYESPLGHRGITHSILFALAISFMITLLFHRKQQYDTKAFATVNLFLFISTFSHGILDAMTTGGLGVGFFIPFTDQRFFLPYRPVLVSPIGFENFFSSWGMAVIKSEIKYIWIPCAILIVACRLLIKRTH